ncbi:hypothetical protein MSG28_005951 [Choristoneura fumiferana]|uniref:Uncharacterized protein n=1 Tax=Choristoneura fumiferana TaxID=7141 RepID=A0ACC0L143_CHOFU|nr:hypothetical protein MSG28_005951 [Choristoneura fumiferana]
MDKITNSVRKELQNLEPQQVLEGFDRTMCECRQSPNGDNIDAKKINTPRSAISTGTDSFTDLGLHDKKMSTRNDSFTDHGFHDKHIKGEGFIWGVATKVFFISKEDSLPYARPPMSKYMWLNPEPPDLQKLNYVKDGKRLTIKAAAASPKLHSEAPRSPIKKALDFSRSDHMDTALSMLMSSSESEQSDNSFMMDNNDWINAK